MQDSDSPRNIEGMTDDELVSSYRKLKAQTVYNGDGLPPDRDRPGELVEKEMTRRGLFPDREDIVPEPFDPDAEHPVEGDTSGPEADSP